MRKTLLLTVTVASAVSALLAGQAIQAKPVSRIKTVGDYSVALKVLTAESFGGPRAAMTRDGGAKPMKLGESRNPEHHMVVFVKKGGKMVKNASVSIRYREIKPQTSEWKDLPVVRMHVSGKGMATTHYGNNVMLGPGTYKVVVAVNGKGSAHYTFTLPAGGR